MDNLTSPFLDAFATIEKHLRRMLDANKYTTFNEMVERAVSRDRSARRLRDQLVLQRREPEPTSARPRLSLGISLHYGINMRR